MEKMVTRMPINFTYRASTPRAPYTFDGKKYMNHGQFMECCCKAAHGLDPVADANTPFFAGSDIPEYHASVKSADCSLFNMQLADSFEASAEIYLDKDASTSFWWAQDVGEELWIYKMNEEEYRHYVYTFCHWDSYSKKIKGGRLTKKLLNWFESLC